MTCSKSFLEIKGVLVLSVASTKVWMPIGGEEKFIFVMRWAVSYGFLFCISPVVIILASTELRTQSLTRLACYCCKRNFDTAPAAASVSLPPFTPRPVLVKTNIPLRMRKLTSLGTLDIDDDNDVEADIETVNMEDLERTGGVISSQINTGASPLSPNFHLTQFKTKSHLQSAKIQPTPRIKGFASLSNNGFLVVQKFSFLFKVGGF